MRRFVLVILLLAGVLAYHSSVGAAGSTATRVPGLATLLRSQANRATSPGMPGRRFEKLGRIAPAPGRQSASSLRVSDTAFAPATINANLDGIADNPTADQLSFRPDHSTTYEALNRLTGYYERADWKPTADTAYFRYQGSVFSSTATAQNAWQDGTTHTKTAFDGTSTDCTSSYGVTCQMVSYRATVSNEPRIFLDYFMVINQCLIETELDANNALTSAYTTQLATTITTINSAAVTTVRAGCNGNSSPPPTSITVSTSTPTPIPSPTTAPQGLDYSIVAVRVQKNSKADWNLVRPPVSEAKAGTTITAAMYWILRSAPGGIKPSYNIAVKRDGKTIAQQNFAGSQPSYTADTYFVHADYKLSKPGKYTFSFRMTFGGKTEKAAASVAALTQQVRRVVKSLALHFDRLQTLNGRNQPTTHFNSGDPVVVKGSFTVRNLNGTAPLITTRIYQYLTPSGWRPLGHPITEHSDTSNGTHSFSVSSVPNPTYNSQRVVVGISVAAHFESKVVAFTIGR